MCTWERERERERPAVCLLLNMCLSVTTEEKTLHLRERERGRGSERERERERPAVCLLLNMCLCHHRREVIDIKNIITWNYFRKYLRNFSIARVTDVITTASLGLSSSIIKNKLQLFSWGYKRLLPRLVALAVLKLKSKVAFVNIKALWSE